MKKTINIKSSWDEITLGEMKRIEDAQQLPPSEQLINIVSILTGESIKTLEELPLTTFNKLGDMINFLSTPATASKLQKKYVLNGKTYMLDARIDQISTGKFMDYQNYSKEEPKDIFKLVSLCLVPKGKTYGKDYDIEETFEDMKQLKVGDYLAIINFMKQISVLLYLTSADYLQSLMKEMKLEKNQDFLNIAEYLNNTAYSLWSSVVAKKL